MKLCEGCYRVRQDERKGPRVNRKQVGEKRSRGKLAVGAEGVEHKIMEMYASKKIYAEDLLKEAAAALNVGTLVLNGSPHKRKC